MRLQCRAINFQTSNLSDSADCQTGVTDDMYRVKKRERVTMREKLKVGSMVICVLATALAVSAQKQSERMQNRRALVQMEHDFAKAAATRGTRDAFLEFLADDGIIFQPGPVNGKKFWTERQPRKGLLSWEPIFADVSRAGDLGYTTGPWEFRPNGPEDQPVAFGQYFTIWKKQSDGSWKAVLDRGVGTERAYAKPSLQFPADDGTKNEKSTVNVVSGRANLTRLEGEFSKKSSLNARDAFASYL